jgi:hypothetical protein
MNSKTTATAKTKTPMNEKAKNTLTQPAVS